MMTCKGGYLTLSIITSTGSGLFDASCGCREERWGIVRGEGVRNDEMCAGIPPRGTPKAMVHVHCSILYGFRRSIKPVSTIYY